jgi:bifunctional non-homologous end joining protein LigD
LPRLPGSAHWNIATAVAHLSAQRQDPWAGYWNGRQSLAPAMKKLGYR